MRVDKASASLAVLLLITAITTAADRQVTNSASADRIRAHIDFLASDLLKGREPGTPGFDIAAEYVASQFRQLGLAPAGDDGTYFQRVPLLAYRLTDRGTFILHGEGGRSIPLAFGDEYLPARSPAAGEHTVSAPLVFAGFGVVAPGRQRDDYRGLDVRGKVVVVMSGAPLDMPSEERAYYVSSRIKRNEAAQRGAVGLIARELADGPMRPAWKPGDFIGSKFARQ